MTMTLEPQQSEGLLKNLEAMGLQKVWDQPEDEPEPLFSDAVQRSDALYEDDLNDFLTDEEREEAETLRPLTRGVMLISGPPRSGKGLIGNTLSYKIKRFYKSRSVFRDEIPCRPFGFYHLFNEEKVMQELAIQSFIARGGDMQSDESKAALEKANKANIKTAAAGYVNQQKSKLNGAVLYLTELYRYVSKRRPHSPMNQTISGIARQWGHLDLLLMGDSQAKNDLDRFSFLPFVTHDIRCAWGADNKGYYNLWPVRFVHSRGCLDVAGACIPLVLDPFDPRKELGINPLTGQYYRNCDLYNTKAAPNLITVKPKITM